MTKATQERSYNPAESVVFRKTDEPFGGLSNMAPGFPLLVNHIRIWTSEALYQCCRFPNAPEVQRLIISERSPMTAKMKSKRFRKELSRPDWDDVRVRVMRWCLQVKLAQNWEKFGELLKRTGDHPIVEESTKDTFWGAKRNESGTLEGANVLGRLLMQLRDEINGSKRDKLQHVPPPVINDFLLMGRPVEEVSDPKGSQDFESLKQVVQQNYSLPYPDESTRYIELHGDVSDKDWSDLIHFLGASGIIPETARVDMQMRIGASTDPSVRESKLKILAELAKRFGIQFRMR